MDIDGSIKRIIYDGYERLILVEDSNRNEYWLHFLQYEEYLENKEESNILTVGQKVLMRVYLNLVNDFKVYNTHPWPAEGIIQPITQSPHSIVSGIVRDRLDDCTLVCSVGGIGELLVSFESEVSIEVGSRIRVSGELWADIN